MRVVVLGVAAAALLSCATQPRPTAETPPKPPSVRVQPVPVWPGVPHRSRLRSAAIAPSGTAAVSLGEAGELRLWTVLDGSRTPLVLPLDTAPHGPVRLDVIGDGARWRAVLVADGQARVYRAEASGAVSVERVFEGASAALLLPEGAALVATAGAVSLIDADGVERSSVPVSGDVAALLPSRSREHALVLTGQTVDTDAFLLWAGGAKVEAFRGAMTAVSVEPEWTLRRRGKAFSFEGRPSLDVRTYALSDDGRQVAYLRDGIYEGALEEDGVALETELFGVVEQVDLETDERTSYEEVWTSAVAFDARGTLHWQGKDGSTLAERPTDASCGEAVCVQPDGPMLHVLDGQTQRWLGAAAFAPSVVAFSPDGRRLAWAENREMDDGFRRGGLRVGSLDADQLGPAFWPEELESVAGLVWHGEDHVLVVSGEGAVFGWNPKSERLTPIDDRGAPVVDIEHEPRADATWLRFDDDTSAVVRWAGGEPTRVFSLDAVPDDLGSLGVSERGVWWGTRSGLATVSFADLWRDPSTTPTVTPLSRRADEVFDVVTARTGELVVDWGDQWEVSGMATAIWERDIPVFGPLRASPEGSALINLPRCTDSPWRVAVHPAVAAELEPGQSYTFDLPEFADVQWAPDGKTLAIASATEGGMLYDLEQRTITRRWTQTEFVALDDEPAQALPAPGRCVSPWDED